MFKNYVQKKLEKFVQLYFQAHPEVKLITVVGSVGKTTTKNMIATLLSQRYRVGGSLDEANYNTEMSVPFSILGVKYPDADQLRSYKNWRRIFKAMKERVKQPATVDVIVQELGIDKPGDMAVFARYLKPDLTVATAIAPEHMANFVNMEAVAFEELSAINFSKMGLINRDDISADFSRFIQNPNLATYGSSNLAENRIEASGFSPETGFSGRFVGPRAPQGFDLSVKIYGEQILRSVVASVAVGLEFGLTGSDIQAGLAKIHPTAGRMNILRGMNNSLLIDDSYNSSPVALREALRALYSFPAQGHRIAVLGSMNELGEMSAQAHQEAGALCNPNLLEWVITVGDDANNYLASAARSNGCQVKTCRNALEAGSFVNGVLRPNSVVLFKGSQNNVYLEEAIKLVLASVRDHDALVRQSSAWLKTKNDYFASFANIEEGDD